MQVLFEIFLNFARVSNYIWNTIINYAKIYGDSILDAHATSAQSLHVRKVRILLIHDFEQILLSHDS